MNNDLTQYVKAGDRLDSRLGKLNSAWEPSVLRLIGLVGEAARDRGKPLGLCGEAASDRLLAPVLVGLGLTIL